MSPYPADRYKRNGLAEDEPSIHHRSESTITDYIKPNGEKQANGGILGDTKILVKYLQKDVGLREGFRIYHGIGLVIHRKQLYYQIHLISQLIQKILKEKRCG